MIVDRAHETTVELTLKRYLPTAGADRYDRQPADSTSARPTTSRNAARRPGPTSDAWTLQAGRRDCRSFA